MAHALSRFRIPLKNVHQNDLDAGLPAAVHESIGDAASGTLDAARIAASRMQGNGVIFAVVFEEGVLLANLSHENPFAEFDGTRKTLSPISMEFVSH